MDEQDEIITVKFNRKDVEKELKKYKESLGYMRAHGTGMPDYHNECAMKISFYKFLLDGCSETFAVEPITKIWNHNV